MPVLTRLDVDPQSFSAASRVFGVDVAGVLEGAWGVLSDGLAATGEMAGSDPSGVAWGVTYDEVAEAAVRALQDVWNGSWRLAALIEQCGLNYGMAESRSIPGRVVPVVDRTSYDMSIALATPESARGGSVPEPQGWSLIRHVLHRVWPNGHQDRLRAAADAWAQAGSRVAGASGDIGPALTALGEQRAPEIDAAVTVCTAMGQHLESVAASFAAISRGCLAFAQALDRAHSQVEHELLSLGTQSVAIQIVGGLLVPLTAGASEVVAQGVQAERIGAVAVRVGEFLAELAETAAAATETLSAAIASIQQVSRDLVDLLRTQIYQVEMSGGGGASLGGGFSRGSASTAASATKGMQETSRLLKTWGKRSTLRDHFNDHAKDFPGCTSPIDYVRRASEFFRRGMKGEFPTKIKKDGTIRIYDPKTNTFGSYNKNGTTRTFYKPRRRAAYWADQEGTLQ